MSNTITIDIVAETKKLVDGVNTTNQQLGKMEQGLGKAGKAAVGLASAFILTKGIDFLGGAIEEAQAAEKALAAANVVFGKTPGLLDKIASDADKFGRALGVDNDVLIEMSTTIGTFLPESLKGMSAELINTGYDVAALTKTDPATWASKFGKAMSDGSLKMGEMTKLFPGLSKEVYAQAEALSKAGDNQAALTLLQGEATKAYGGAAESQVTASQKMTVAVDALKEKIGTFLLPILDKAVGVLTKMVDWVTQNSDVMMPLAAVIGVVGGAILIANVAMGAWSAITTAWGAATKIATAVQWLFNAAMLANPIVLVIAAIVAIIAIIVLLIANWDKVTEVVGKVWEAIKEWGSKVWEFMQQIWQWLQDLFKKALEFIWTAIQWYFNAYKTVIETVFNFVKDFLGKAWDFIKDIFSKAFEFIKDAVQKWVDFHKLVITTVFNAIKDFFSKVWDGIKEIFKTVMDWISKYVETQFNMLKKGIEVVWNAIKTLFTTVWEGIKTAVTNGINAVKTVIETTLNTIKTIAENIWNAFKTTVSTIWDGIKNIIQTVVDNVVSKIGELPAKALEIGKAMVTGIWNGLQSMGGWLQGQISGWVGGMIESAKSALGINSPSKEFAKLGSGIVEGLGLGINKNVGIGTKAVRNLSGAVIKAYDVPTLKGSVGGGTAPVQITINAGVGTDPYELGRTVTKALNKYSNISRTVYA